MPLTVVAVDDDIHVLELLAASAEEQDDFDVVATGTDSGAVSTLLRAHRPDVLILDHGFDDPAPVIDLREGHSHGRTPLGLQLVGLAHEIVPGMTVVLFTGWEGLEIAAANVGVDLLVQKPEIESIWPAIRRFRTVRSAPPAQPNT